MKYKLIAILLAFSMVMSISSIATNHVMAASNPSYVSVGDSMSNGLGLNGYDMEDGTSVNGFLQVAEDAYPALIADYYDFDLTQLATSSFRAEDVYALLTYKSSNSGEVRFDSLNWTITGPVGKSDIDFDGYFAEAVVGRCEDYDGGVGFKSGKSKFNGRTYYDGVAWVAAQYQDAVSNADVITLALGGNNFGTFLSMTLMNQLKEQFGLNMGGIDYGITDDDLEDRIDELDAEYKEIAENLYDLLRNELSLGNSSIIQSFLPSNITNFIDTMALYGTYSFVGYILGYQGVLEYIDDHNPEADVIMLSLNNTLHDFKIDLMGNGLFVLNLGDFFEVIYNSANDVAKDLAADYDLNIYYAEASDDEVEIIYNALKPDHRGNVNWKGYEVAKSRFISGMKNEIQMIKAANGLTSDEDALETLLGMAHSVDALNISAILAYMTNDKSDMDLYNAGLNSSLHLAFRFTSANGIGCHPSIKGHEAMKLAIIEAYDVELEEDEEDEEDEEPDYVVVNAPRSAMLELGNKNILDTIDVTDKNGMYTKLSYDAGKKYKNETIYVLKYSKGEYTLIDTLVANDKGKITFVVQDNQEYILSLVLPEELVKPLVYGWESTKQGWKFYDYFTGEQQFGWIADGVHWYFLDYDTGIMYANEWIASDSTGAIWYYVDYDGAMARDTWIDGLYVDQDGIWRY